MTLREKKAGHRLLWLDSVGSTNDIARELALAGGEEGTIVLAREQTAGRGSKGRSWVSATDLGLYLSMILRPRIAPDKAAVLTLGAAVAVTETIKDEFNIDADIKWPNDVLIRNRKVCGILVESAIERESVLYAILGIGVNLTQHFFPVEIAESATSLLIECNREIGVHEFLPPLLKRLDRWCLNETAPEGILDRYRLLSSYANGCEINVTQGTEGTTFEGITRGLTASGALIVETSSGEVKTLFSGEVTKIRAKGESRI